MSTQIQEVEFSLRFVDSGIVVDYPDGRTQHYAPFHAGDTLVLRATVGSASAAEVRDVAAAWTEPGRAPWFHRKAQERLHRQWPVLAAALEGLAKVSR